MIREETDLFREALAANADGVWIWYVNEDYEFYDSTFKEQLGYSDKEFPNTPDSWRNVIFEDDLTIALNNFTAHVESKGEYPYYQVVRYRHKDGSTVYFICRGKVIKWDGDDPIVMIGTHTNITDIIKDNELL